MSTIDAMKLPNNFVNVILLATGVIGAVFLIGEIRRGPKLKSDYERLVQSRAKLEVEDRSKFLVAASSEKSNRQFQWRTFVPGFPTGFKTVATSVNEDDRVSSNTSSKAAEIQTLVRFLVLQGKPQLHYGNTKHIGMHWFPDELDSFLIQHWSELQFNVLGIDNPVQISGSEVVHLFSVSIPTCLKESLPQELSANQTERFLSQPLFEFSIADSSLLSTRNEQSEPFAIH